MAKKTKAPKGTVKKVLKYISGYTPLLILSLIFAAVSVALTLAIPLLCGKAIDCIADVGKVDMDGIFTLLVQVSVCIGGAALSQWLMNVINNKITYQVVRDIRKDAFDKIQILPFSYIDSHRTGETVSRVISDVDQFAEGLLMGFTQLFTGALTIVGTLIFMLTVSPGITAVVVVLTPLSLFVAAFIAKRIHSMFTLRASTTAEQTAYIDEMIGGAKVITAYGSQKRAQERFDEINDRLGKCTLKAIFYSSLINPCTRFVNTMVYTTVALVGALAVIGFEGGTGAIFTHITVGSLSCLLTYANQYTKPFNEISGVVTELQNALTCASRIFELIEESPEIPDKTDAAVLTSPDGRVALHDVSFSYVPERKLIEGLSLNVSAGQKIAIVGPTGCGKTTLINLLMRFYDVTGGCIRMGEDGGSDYDLRDMTRASVRASYGMVLQDTWLKRGTIRENLLIGKPDATDEELIAAAKAAHAHSFIKRLPNGYDTVIGEDGGSLSGGQKQLLCITRVMLSPPPMLILDEATSSIDTRTEQRIQKAFNTLMQGRTSFIVAHRLSTIRNSDLILVMKDGNVIEQGTHSQLIARNGFYTHLYNSGSAAATEGE